MRSITYILLSKIFEFTWNAVIFFLKKKKCDIFIEKREKQNKSWKNKLEFEKNLRNDQSFSNKSKSQSGNTENSLGANPNGA